MIDILLPYYGNPEQMRDAVRSILGQTDPDWRLVIVDDNYPDPDIRAWLESLGSTDERVEYHRNEENLGANLNYSKALSMARAELVVIMGADDVMLPNYVEVVSRAARQFPGAAVYQCGVRVIDGDGKTTHSVADVVKRLMRPSGHKTAPVSGDALMASLLHGNWTYFPSLCWRTQVVSEIRFRSQFHVVQDLALLIDVLAAGNEMVLMPEVAFHYRRHAGSDSSQKTLAGSRFHEEADYFRLAARNLDALGYPRARRAARVHLTSRLHAAMLLPRCLLNGDGAATRALVQHALDV